MNKYIKKSVDLEKEVIGNIINKYLRPTLFGQQRASSSPQLIAGDITLAFHRGLNVARDETISKVVFLLHKKYPDAAKLISEQFKTLYK